MKKMDKGIFLEKLSALGVNAEIEMDEEEIKVKLGEEKGSIRAFLDEKNIHIPFYSGVDEKVVFLLIEWLKDVANQENKQLVIERMSEKENQIETWLENNNYKKINKKEKSLYVLSNLSPRKICERQHREKRNKIRLRETYEYLGNIYMVEEVAKKIENFFQLYKKAMKKLNQIYEKEPLFFYKKRYDHYDFHFDYYAWGEKGEIRVSFENENMFAFLFKKEDRKEKEIQVFHQTDIEVLLTDWAEKTKRKQGIKQLFNSETEPFFFKELMRTGDFNKMVSENMIEDIHACLLQFHAFEDIEKISSNYLKIKVFPIYDLPVNMYYFYFDGKVYLVDQNERNVYALDHSDTLEKEMKKLIMDILENKVDEKLNINSRKE